MIQRAGYFSIRGSSVKEQDLFFVKNLCAAYFLLKNIRNEIPYNAVW